MRKLLALISLFAILVFMPLCSLATVQQRGGGQTNGHGGNPAVKVWINTSTHVYHCPGTRYYGNTKRGKYATQKAAQDAGNRPAYGGYCQ